MVGLFAQKVLPANRYLLPLLWVGQVGLVLLLALFNPNHFTTIDSGYYLASAQYLLDGQGHVYEEGGRLVWNGIFPLGYPLCIAIVAFLTQLPVLWASKLVNVLASAGLLLIVQRKWGVNKALLMGALLLLGPFVKLWAHTWSEPLFLTLLFFWVYYFFSDDRSIIIVLALGLALMLVRYAGLFIVPLSAGMALYWYLTHQRQRGLQAAALSLLWALGFSGYLWLNYQQSGDWYGGDRISGSEPTGQVLLLFGKGLFNELFLLRDATFESSDALFWLGAVIQVLLVWLMVKEVAKQKSPIPRDASSPVHYYWLTAGAYLLFLFVLRLISPFDPPGYRLLSPFTFLLIWGCMVSVAPYLSVGKAKWLALALLLASWLHLLPQADVVGKLSKALGL
ncbi:hypothetical protein [Telluribacter sp. SYSU D00476]|uniref:hypothetical protein n=1 Tax=Telluribacter sp. SYSU D00476 TaxID=2811430 RepID=UPI001FF6B8F4|nr:hypothetical protein [Telluribacter sp. SYSU D00476]